MGESAPSDAPAGQLILRRPRSLATGLLRRIRIYLDNNQVADLKNGDTAYVPTPAGPHMLQARCRPLGGAELPFILDDRETLRAQIYVGVLEDVRIELDSQF